jgi:hypothetical protein
VLDADTEVTEILHTLVNRERLRSSATPQARRAARAPSALASATASSRGAVIANGYLRLDHREWIRVVEKRWAALQDHWSSARHMRYSSYASWTIHPSELLQYHLGAIWDTGLGGVQTRRCEVGRAHPLVVTIPWW